MKKAFEYYIENIKHNPFMNFNKFQNDLLKAIHKAQIDAIEETVKLCAENAKCTFDDYDDFLNGRETYIVDKDSILNCAEILRKEL